MWNDSDSIRVDALLKVDEDAPHSNEQLYLFKMVQLLRCHVQEQAFLDVECSAQCFGLTE